MCRPRQSHELRVAKPTSPRTFASPIPSKRAKPGGQLLCRTAQQPESRRPGHHPIALRIISALPACRTLMYCCQAKRST